MPAPVELVSVIVVFGLITVAGARLGAGSHLSLSGLFVSAWSSEWPRGVQESDVPHFAVEHADGLRHPPPAVAPYEELGGDDPQATRAEIVELHVGRVTSHR